ncbi:MAG: flagellar biosynthesis anti-sigma factor FlgM [Candidatus Berkiella sp.]
MNNLNLELYSLTTQKGQQKEPQSKEVKPELPPAELKGTPSSEISLQLQKFQQKIHEVPLVNEQKVSALKQQIADKTFGIQNGTTAKETAFRIADKMLNMENDLFGKKA